tara:strand:+ start:7283 stop:7795 length:513 start_codon:yes stop_codon:yes gene_type:complete
MKFRILNFKSVNSTNDVAIRLIKNNKVSPTIVVSENQKKGRGQHGKKWISIKGNIFMSFFFQLNNNYKIINFTKKNCQILKRLFMKVLKRKVTIKLPNDLLIGKKKICGILQEIIEHNNRRYIIVGIGINLIKSPKINNYSSGYLEQFSRKKINRSYLLGLLKKEFEKNY